MVKTEKLETIIEKCRIIKEFSKLPEPVLGYYTYDGGYYIILINESIKNNERLYRTVLAEEIGHYRTTIGDLTPRKYMCYRDRIHIDKYELMALKWATNFLVPTEELLEVIKNSVSTSLNELADYFFVTKEFIDTKFKFMAKMKPIWELSDTKLLYLYKYPSIFVYDKRGFC